jgi:hypothetical protein
MRFVGRREIILKCIGNKYIMRVKGKDKSIPGQALRVPGVEAPRFQDNRHMNVARLSDPRTGHIYLFLYSFLLEAVSTPGQQIGRKDYVNEKLQ